ncbi:MAG: helix-turn-helix domain-containing protein [Ruminococcus flavefaciens]|nr:helix-turn-helix domain-containing protein [Ruminococcus flavefaciens]
MLSSQELYDKIDNERIKKELSKTALSDKSGISHNTLVQWKKRNTMPKLEVLDALCEALDVPLAYILFDVAENSLTSAEIELLSIWKSLNEEQQNALKHLIKSLQKR